MDMYTYKSRKETPSFSSALLDIIYQSVDATDHEESVAYRKTMRNRHSIDGFCSQADKQMVDSLRRSGGSKNIGNVAFRRKSAIGASQRSEDNIGYSKSRYRSQFSSTEAETMYGFPATTLRPLRTGINELSTLKINTSIDDLQPRANCEGKLVKTKSRAMKIYRYLKKAKSPISPGGRLASFLVSLFGTTNAKKPKISSPDNAIVHANRKSEPLNETPSSVKKKVRFYPASVNVIDGSLNGDRSRTRSDSPAVKFAVNSINKEIKVHSTEKNLDIEETTRNLLRNYQKKVEYVFDSIKSNDTSNNDDYDDEGASYASSDLFELDHLSAIGIEQCMQELPLYETTSVDANRAIAKAMCSAGARRGERA